MSTEKWFGAPNFLTPKNCWNQQIVWRQNRFWCQKKCRGAKELFGANTFLVQHNFWCEKQMFGVKTVFGRQKSIPHGQPYQLACFRII